MKQIERHLSTVADRIVERMGPLFGSPEYLADPVKRARSEKRQREAAESYARIALEACAEHIDALEARVAAIIQNSANLLAEVTTAQEKAERQRDEAVEALKPFADLDHEETAAASLLGARDGNAAVRVPRRHLRKARAFISKITGEEPNP